MDNRCLIIMPPSEPSGYSQGHFSRVYDYVIVPACRAAGFWPTKAEGTAYENPLDVVKNLIDTDVVLCDLSANNANALYGIAVRSSLDLPVVLAKDAKSFVMFDTSEFGVVEYDESLRIDTVQKAIEVLGEALKKAVESKKERHTLLNRLSIGLAQYNQATVENVVLYEEPAVQEEVKPKEPKLPIISPLPDYVGDPFSPEQIDKLKAGDVLFHLNHGKGKINTLNKSGKERLANIQFDSGSKFLVLVASDFFRRVN